MREPRLHAVPMPEHGQRDGRKSVRSVPPAAEPLWRHMLGDHLRRLRVLAGQTLGETARRAGVSPQYLSEMERGVKDPSSEMIAAVAGALGVTLLDLTVAVARELNGRRATAQRQERTNAHQSFTLAA